MQYSVPQFIDVEDKIVGPFTGKQTLFLVIGGGILMVSLRVFSNFFFIVIFVIVAPVTLLFVFYRPKGISLSKFVLNALNFFTSPHLYVWRREPDVEMYKIVQKKQKVGEDPVKFVPRSRIRELANLLDTSHSIDAFYDSDARLDENDFSG